MTTTWWREVVELAGVFTMAGAAEFVAAGLGRRSHGPLMVIALGALILAAAVAHRWWVHRRSQATRRVDRRSHQPTAGCPARQCLAWHLHRGEVPQEAADDGRGT